MIKESDWEIFKKIKERSLERFCQKANTKFETILKAKADSHHSKYRALFKAIKEEDKEIAEIFDMGHSRSKMQLQLVLLRKNGLVENIEFLELSEELRNSIDLFLK